MNIRANSVFHALQGVAQSVAKFTTEPLCADLFQWCQMTGIDTRLETRLRLLQVPAAPVSSVSLLKKRLESRIAVEPERIKDKRSPDINRLIALKQALETVEKFEGAQ